MACIYCALVQGYLLTVIVPTLLGRHLATELGLVSGWGRGGGGGAVVLGKCSGCFLCSMRDLGSTQHQVFSPNICC